MPTTNSEKSFSLQQVYQQLEAVCSAHLGVAHFDSGTEEELGGRKTYAYPLAYLEEVIAIQEDDSTRTNVYDVALNILDLVPKDATREQRVAIQDKCFQMFVEIKQYLRDHVFGAKRVFGFNVSVSPDFNNDAAMRIRGEFRIQVGSIFTTCTPSADLKALFPTL